MIRTTNVFAKNLDAYNKDIKIIINQGGSSSSKTYSILQLLFLIALYSKEKLIISIVSQTLPHLKTGAIRDLKNIIASAGLDPDKLHNKSDKFFTIGKSIIEYFSVDAPGKAHGARRDILYMNECNYSKYDIYIHLSIRTKLKVFVDFNPTREFWVHTDVMPNKKHLFIKSTYLDNPYLDESIIADLQSFGKNENFRRVYLLGEIGLPENIVFNNFRYGKFDETLDHLYGLDFGFSESKDAFVKVAVDYKQHKIYVHELFYVKGMAQDKLFDLLIQTAPDIITDKKTIVADSAEPRMIADFIKKKLNIRPAIKTKGSVMAGIKFLQSFEIIITESSFNLYKEINNYIYSDKVSQLVVKENDHLIDALRYAVYWQKTVKKI